MKLEIKAIWTKVESDGGLYQSDLKIFDREDKEIIPMHLLKNLSGMKLNDVLYLERQIDEEDDFSIVITNGTSYESNNIYLGDGEYGISEHPSEEDMEALKDFFNAISDEYKMAVRNLKSETFVYEF